MLSRDRFLGFLMSEISSHVASERWPLPEEREGNPAGSGKENGFSFQRGAREPVGNRCHSLEARAAVWLRPKAVLLSCCRNRSCYRNRPRNLSAGYFFSFILSLSTRAPDRSISSALENARA